MPILDTDENVQYNFEIDGEPVAIQILHSALPSKPFYFRAIVDGETVENYADSEGEAFRKAFKGIDWLLSDGDDD